MASSHRLSLVLACVLALASTYNVRAEEAMESNETMDKETFTEVLYDNNEITKVFKDMSDKLEEVLNNQGACQRDGASPRQCVDLVSGQSVLTQLCDKIYNLETRLDRVTRKASSRKTNPNHNENSSGLDLQSLRDEIAVLKRSSVFYASRMDKISNFTQDKITDYDVKVNKGIGFDPFLGVFKAPYEGIYHFSLSYSKKPELTLNAFLVVDNVVVATVQDDHHAYMDFMTDLQEGQEVWTDISTNQDSDDTPVSLTFSGYFVQ